MKTAEIVFGIVVMIVLAYALAYSIAKIYKGYYSLVEFRTNIKVGDRCYVLHPKYGTKMKGKVAYRDKDYVMCMFPNKGNTKFTININDIYPIDE